MITGTDADDVCAPEKKSDWLGVATISNNQQVNEMKYGEKL
jgi:hypothetical protein